MLGYCGVQEIEEMRRRLRELEKLEFEIPPAASHGNPVANTTISVCLLHWRLVFSVRVGAELKCGGRRLAGYWSTAS
jgi:hypothetical protein